MVTLVDQSGHGDDEPRLPSCRACGESFRTSTFSDHHQQHRAARLGGGGDTQTYRCCLACEDCRRYNNRQSKTMEDVERRPRSTTCQQCQQPIHSDDSRQRIVVTCAGYAGCSNEACYEWSARLYCRYHFSMLPGTQCAGCDEAILRQFVEHHNYPGKRWHPECYMIQKFWNVRLSHHQSSSSSSSSAGQDTDSVSEPELRRRQATMEAKVNRIWTELSAFEESSATCISDMLLHVAAGAYSEALRMANQFAMHLKVLFSALELVNAMLVAESGLALSCFQESRSLCSLVVCFLHLLAQQQDPANLLDSSAFLQHQQPASSTQGLLSLVTGIAQNLKSLIRIGLTGALKLERQFDRQDAIPQFLDHLLPLEKKRVWLAGRFWFKDEAAALYATNEMGFIRELGQKKQHTCYRCDQIIHQDEECYRHGPLEWHALCFCCTKCHRSLGSELHKARLMTAVSRAAGGGGRASHPAALAALPEEKMDEEARQQQGVQLVCSSCWSAASNDYYADEKGFVHVTRLEQSLTLVTSALQRLCTTLYYGSPAPSPSPTPPSAAPAAKQQRDDEEEIKAIHSDQDTKKIQLQDHDSRLYSTERKTSTIRRRHASLLRFVGRNMSNSNDTSNDTRKNNRHSMFGSAHLTHVPVNRATRVFDAGGDAAATAATRGISTANKFSTLQRAFSINNKRRERRSIYGVFDRNNNNGSGKEQVLQQQQQQDQHVSPATTSTTLSSQPQQIISLAELTGIQDMIVRHMAVFYIERYSSYSFSTDQLLQFIEGKRSSLWGRLKAHIRQHGRVSVVASDSSSGMRTFGMPLSETVARMRDLSSVTAAATTITAGSSTGGLARDNNNNNSYHNILAPYFSPNAQVPEFVKKCISRLLNMDVTVEGVFRKNGNIRELNELRDAINQNCGISLDTYMNDEESPIQLAALLKRYLRELPEPLLTLRLYDVFIASIRIDDETRAKTMLHMACCMLPKPHRDTMQLLFLFLKWIASFQSLNKMDVYNLACVFAPTIFYSPHASKDTPEERQQAAKDEIKVVEMLIQYQDQFCRVPSEFMDVLFNSQAADCFKDGVGSRQVLKNLQALVQIKPIDEKAEAMPEDVVENGARQEPVAVKPTATMSTKRTARRSWIPGRLQ